MRVMFESGEVAKRNKLDAYYLPEQRPIVAVFLNGILLRPELGNCESGGDYRQDNNGDLKFLTYNIRKTDTIGIMYEE